MKKMDYILNKLNEIQRLICAWIEWQDAKEWAKIMHPSWVYFATQRKRAEIRTTYRKKILEAYRRGY